MKDILNKLEKLEQQLRKGIREGEYFGDSYICGIADNINNIKELLINDAKIDKKTKVLKQLLDYRSHKKNCDFYYTDFCTCGLKDIADKARQYIES